MMQPITATQTTKQAPKQVPKQSPQRNAPTPTEKPLEISHGVSIGGQRIVIYGPGGIGKSTLCANLAKIDTKPLFLDIGGGETQFLDVARYEPRRLEEVRQLLHDTKLLEDYDAVVIDSLTALEELCVTWVLANIKHDETGQSVTSREGYGFSKGYTHIFEAFLQVLGDLDAVIRSDKHVICTAHDCTAKIPNPNGEDWIRYEPRLQSPPNGKGAIRLKVREWSDHLFFIGYDLHVNKKGKASGVGSRTIYPVEMPTHMAKSRCLSQEIVYERGDAEIWKLLFNESTISKLPIQLNKKEN